MEKQVTWTWHGGLFLTTQGYSAIHFLLWFEKLAAHLSREGTSLLYPRLPARDSEKILDWRLSFTTMGVSMEDAEYVRKVLLSREMDDDLITALWLVTDEFFHNNDTRLNTIAKQVRDFMGVPDNLRIILDYIDLESNEVKP